MNLSHLHYFETLAEMKNFSDAARAESISQPTLSQAINGLEKELGCQLFIRKKGSVDLTEKGSQFYAYVRTSLRFLSTGIKLTRNDASHKQEIRMGTIFSAQSKEWSDLLYAFRKQINEDVSVSITQESTETLVSKLKNGSLDIAFIDEPLNDDEIGCIPCWAQGLTLIVNRRHPFSKYRSISLDELEGHYLISYELQGQLGKDLAALINGIPLQIGYRYKDEITLASIVSSNPDIMALACRSWLLDAYRDDVRLLTIKEAPKDFRQLYLVYRMSARQNDAVLNYLQLAKNAYMGDNADKAQSLS